jgi:hypothetical protein
VKHQYPNSPHPIQQHVDMSKAAPQHQSKPFITVFRTTYTFNFKSERATRTVSTHTLKDIRFNCHTQDNGIWHQLLQFICPPPQLSVRQQIRRKPYNQISNVNKCKLVNVT